MEVNCWIRRSGIESALDVWEGGIDSGMFEIEEEDSKGGTGGKDRCACRGCVGEGGFTLAAAD